MRPYFQENEQLRVFADLLPVARFAPNVSDWERVADETIRALQQIYLGQQDAEEALGAAAERVNETLR